MSVSLRTRKNAYLNAKSQLISINNADQPLRSKRMSGLCCDRLMQRGAGGIPQALNLVLDHQFPALEFDNLQIIC
jgi:hypothetical protein